MTETQTIELIDAVKSLPPERIDEVKDFAIFLKERYAKPEIIDDSDEWSDEDLRDFTAASLDYFEKCEQEGDAAK